MARVALLLILLAIFPSLLHGQNRTYCNPLNLDYAYTPIPDFSIAGRHRATADPVIVNYKGEYFLFSTNQWGYWKSSNLSDWTFIPRRFLREWNKVYDELCAPAVGIIGDTMIVMGSTYTSDFTIWMSVNPSADEWKPLVERFAIGGWDPAFFTDDDGKLYMYNGSSNRYPLYGIQLSRKTMEPYGTRKEMYLLEPWRYGWQRFGENNDNTWLDPFLEGASMTKHNGKYYLEYAAPGTEFSGYADGVLKGDSPLGPFVNQPMPLSYKPGGFARGAGHGSTFRDNSGNYWHVATSVISVKNNFERRLSIWPAGFDAEGVMYCNTAFGDYPTYLPDGKTADHRGGRFTGWMLLNYNKPVQVSSSLPGFGSNYAVDENIRTYWSAASGKEGEWIISDLGTVSEVRAVQINYADQDADFLGKQENIYHSYLLQYSTDGKKWTTLSDRSKVILDTPHDYLELKTPVKARYLKMANIHVPSGKFALSGLRVFGTAAGEVPQPVKGFSVFRTETDKRSAYIKWYPSADAYAYNLYIGTEPGKYYNCIMVYGANEYWFRGMDNRSVYYFVIEPLNETGRGARSEVLRIE